MSRYSIPLVAAPAQTFSVQLGGNRVRVRIQWMTRYSVFRVDIRDSANNPITLGRVLNIETNLFNQTYPPVEEPGFGILKLTGSEPTPTNLGTENTLIWTDEVDG